MNIDVETYLKSAPLPTIDVRSPGEFASGHIPGAINVALFDDAQRAEVGTMYKQVGRPQAVVRGLQLVGSKADQLLKSVQTTGVGPEIVVHCWRGGMRSEGVAWFLEACGFQPQRLRGGYQAFRRAAHHSFADPKRIIILAGPTGAGKTQLLWSLRESGQQVIDLEQLAGHRGSAFGGISRPPQPTVEQFENDLFMQWRELDPDRPVWIECESQGIGRVFVPQGVWAQMSSAPAIFVEVDRQQRLEFLVTQYGGLPKDELAIAAGKLRKRFGGARLQSALEALEQDDLHTFAEIALQYYDKAYSRSLEKHPRSSINSIQLPAPGQTDSLEQLHQMAVDLTQRITDQQSRPGSETGFA